MTPNDIALVQSSFARIAPISDETGANFYARLFDIAPELRPLFRGDLDEQGRRERAAERIPALRLSMASQKNLVGIASIRRTIPQRISRYFGIPKRIMPPASGPASRTVTA